MNRYVVRVECGCVDKIFDKVTERKFELYCGQNNKMLLEVANNIVNICDNNEECAYAMHIAYTSFINLVYDYKNDNKLENAEITAEDIALDCALKATKAVHNAKTYGVEL